MIIMVDNIVAYIQIWCWRICLKFMSYSQDGGRKVETEPGVGF